MDKSKVYLVTGAAGEVGFQVAKLLCDEGFKARAMVRASSDRSALSTLPLEIVEADLTDQQSLERAFEGVEGVFHIAAVYRESGLTDETFYDVNARGTQRVFDAAVAAGVRRVVHCSTGGVLGDIKNPPGSHLTPYNPGDVYQRSKVEAEKIALEYYRSGKMRGAIIRPAMVYGPGDTRHLKLFRMVARRRFFYVGAGDKSVHFIDIRDLARGFLLAMQHSEVNAEIYHIAGGRPMSLKQAVNTIAICIGVEEPWIHLPKRFMQWAGSACELICKPFGIAPPLYRRRVDFFTKARFFDTEKAQRELGFHPRQSFEAEIRDTVAWYRERGML